ncbi:MAG: sulfur oxidation c-type cytochrome SoxA [Alphaproteobacteria bacterium]|nr:sulfur oxidation c-type cytochrome SoxA [Alphaproteobacteria bacterium]
MQGGGSLIRLRLLAVPLIAIASFASSPSGWTQSKEPPPLALDGSASPQPWQRYRDWNKARWDAYNTLDKRDLTKPAGSEIQVRTVTGDAANGQKLAFDRSRGGGCLACHVMGARTQALPGNVGVDLSEVGTAGRTDQWLFNYIYDPRVYNPESVMPPWGKHGFYNEAEIRDMVAFLKTLKTPTKFADPLDNPERRPVPVEDRDALDPFVNPAAERIEAGAALFAKVGPNGKACAACHSDPKAAFVRWAVEMPKWESRLGKVLGAEEFIARHALATTGAAFFMQSRENTDLSIFLHSLANGQPIKVDLSSPEAKAAFERGVALSKIKIGQFNFSCIDCHEKGANKWLRGQWLGEARGQFDHFPLWRTSRSEIWDIRKRFQWCNVQVRANELQPDAPEYGELELYLRKMNEGLTLTAPNIRH